MILQKLFDKFLNTIFSVNTRGMMILKEQLFLYPLFKPIPDIRAAVEGLNRVIARAFCVPEDLKGGPSNSSASVAKVVKKHHINLLEKKNFKCLIK